MRSSQKLGVHEPDGLAARYVDLKSAHGCKRPVGGTADRLNATALLHGFSACAHSAFLELPHAWADEQLVDVVTRASGRLSWHVSLTRARLNMMDLLSAA